MPSEPTPTAATRPSRSRRPRPSSPASTTARPPPPDGGAGLVVVACGALAREIVALRDLNGWDHLDLRCLPAILHNHPESIVPAVEAAVLEAAGRPVFVAYADCGTGGLLRAACDRLGVGMIRGPHCYAFFEGVDAFAERGELTAFYLTDFLARQFDAFVWEPLGLDRHPELRDVYFGRYDRLVFLAQTEDADLTARAQGAAERLGLRFERRHTGYGELATALAGRAG